MSNIYFTIELNIDEEELNVMDNMSERGTVKIENSAKQHLNSQTLYTYQSTE